MKVQPHLFSISSSQKWQGTSDEVRRTLAELADTGWEGDLQNDGTEGIEFVPLGTTLESDNHSLTNDVFTCAIRDIMAMK